MKIDASLTPQALLPAIKVLWQVSGPKILAIDAAMANSQGAPVHTVAGRYQPRGWTEWTRGFEYGAALLQYDATGDASFLALALSRIPVGMPAHVTAFGVHDHGFNQVSTYGTLRRLLLEGRIADDRWLSAYVDLALRCSGAVQARRWTDLGAGEGFIHSFNGPHSLFVDTLRTLRVLLLAHHLGHTTLGEGDQPISLLGRAIAHLRATARYNVFYGEGRDIYDERGRTAHEAIFDTTNGAFRSVATQQGYSPYSTWTRGLSWAMLGFAELLEYFTTLSEAALKPWGSKSDLLAVMDKAAAATCDFYLAHSTLDGIPYWDTGAPGLYRVEDPYGRRSDPGNDVEPLDSSAAAIAAQGLLRYGAWRQARGNADGARYQQAGLTVTATLLAPPYLSTDLAHQGLLLHSQYHRPNGWDYVPPGHHTPFGEATMWGDYHLRELALMVQRQAEGGPALTFFGPMEARP
jgi:hypothetical protein